MNAAAESTGRRAAIVCGNSLLALQPEPRTVAASAARAGAQNLIRPLAAEFAPKGIHVVATRIGLVDSGPWRRRPDAREDRSVGWGAWSTALAARKGLPLGRLGRLGCLGRLGRPGECARAIPFLATSASSYTTGGHLDVSGGLARHV